MRGKDHFDVKGQFRCGITPAYAGKRHNDRNGQVTEKDHPRVCGEKSRSGLNLPRSWGSPPRMRGKGEVLHLRKKESGITPAYAGKSQKLACRGRPWEDHPRVCGEKTDFLLSVHLFPGSPPRMRGKVFYFLLSIFRLGITPAYAGKREGANENDGGLKDHPRVCGEKTKKIP